MNWRLIIGWVSVGIFIVAGILFVKNLSKQPNYAVKNYGVNNATVHILTANKCEGVVGTESEPQKVEGTGSTIYKVLYEPPDAVIAEIRSRGKFEVLVIADDSLVASEQSTDGDVSLKWAGNICYPVSETDGTDERGRRICTLERVAG